VTLVTPDAHPGIPLDEEGVDRGDLMNFRCHDCHRDFAFESGSYSYVHSQIVLHMSQCIASRELSKDERTRKAADLTDVIFFTPHRAGR
jgi:hypothetical protein